VICAFAIFYPSVFCSSKLHFCPDFIAFATTISGGHHGNSQ